MLKLIRAFSLIAAGIFLGTSVHASASINAPEFRLIAMLFFIVGAIDAFLVVSD
jgi:hypothetical protein